MRRRSPDTGGSSAADDPVLDVGFDVVRELAETYEVVWLSGRPAQQRRLTEQWLAEHRRPRVRLFLRPAGDYRPAAQFKLEVVHGLAETDGVAAVLDDDPAVVEALRAAGYPVVLADWVPHERTLAEAQERDGKT